MQTSQRHSYTTSGFSLVEMVVYVSILGVIILLLFNITFSFASTYRELAALRAADHAGIDAMERMTREIRDASGIDMAGTVFGAHPGALALINMATTTRFYLQNNHLHMDVDGTYAGPLTGSSSVITNLVFTLLSTTTRAMPVV